MTNLLCVVAAILIVLLADAGAAALACWRHPGGPRWRL
jgi:hypothetical protein